jgi:hypothetical protein
MSLLLLLKNWVLGPVPPPAVGRRASVARGMRASSPSKVRQSVAIKHRRALS